MTGSTGTAAELAGLRTQVSGTVYDRDEPTVFAEPAGVTIAPQHAPIAVVEAADAHDVAAAVRWAGRQGIAVGVHTTGPGSPPHPDVLIISTRRLTRYRLDPDRRTATVGAGVRWHTVIAAAAQHGLAPLNGFSRTAGVVGYTLGGGFGPLARQYGFAADHVRSLDLVTADGGCVHVSPTREPDLYWAVLGAPGSFGVVTRLEFDVMPVRRIYGGALYFPADQAAAVLHAFRRWTTDLPDSCTASIALLHRGAPVQLRFTHIGDGELGAQVLAPMRSTADVLADTVAEMPYPRAARILADPLEPARSCRTGAYLDAFDADAVQALLTAARAARQLPATVVELCHLGGALGRLPARPNCVGGRDAQYLLGVAAHRPGPVADTVRGRCARVVDALAPWSADLIPANRCHQPDGQTVLPVVWSRADHARLQNLKRAYDPDNTFRVGPTVQPLNPQPRSAIAIAP